MTQPTLSTTPSPTQAHTLRLVLGDQLSPLHSWFQAPPDAGVVVVLMEVRQETDYVRHHAQKVLAIFAAMRAFAAEQKAAGHRVRYIAIDDASNRQAIIANLEALAAAYGAQTVEYQQPDEWRLDHQLAQWAQAQRGQSGVGEVGGAGALRVVAVDSEHFYTTRTEAAQLFAGRKQWLMEHFYRTMRKRHGVLLDTAGEPEGGQWNYDHDNRKPWSGKPAEPADLRPLHDHSALWATIQAAGVQTMGSPQASSFRWPLNREEALAQLDAFVVHGLPHFGDYQDALSTRGWRLFHSLLSFALNVKMLRPQEVVARAEAAWRAGNAPLAAAEGFIRQILGWREYVRGVYWAHMPGYTTCNALGHERELPAWFWTGDTRMACMKAAIGQSLEHAYAHHIQRLMVVGNFALLAGLHPEGVHQWYLGIYIDAFEWVEAPNVLGMSQFADGGRLATKPYVSSAAYLDRMGDHCKGCHYQRKERYGEQACPFNALYWDFYDRHEDAFSRNPRIGMAYRQLQKMAPAERERIRAQARHTLERIDTL